MPDVNLRYCLAAAATKGRLSFDAAHDVGPMADSTVVAMGERISMLGPKANLERFASIVEVDTTSGCTHRAEQDRKVLGRAKNPMSRSQVEGKAFELMKTVLRATDVEAAITLLSNVDRHQQTRDLITLLTLPQA